MASGSRSVDGTCTVEALAGAGAAGIAPVMSLADIGAAVTCGITICALSSVFGAETLLDCRRIGVGEVIEGAAGAGIAGSAVFSAGDGATGATSLEFSIGGICGALLVSSSVIAILKVPSTITTTLAPTSSERIFEEMVEGSPPASALALTPALSFALSFALAFAAALAAA